MVTLFLMTHKGLYFLQNINIDYLGLISQVVIGADGSIENDYQSEIIEFCKNNKINYRLRSSLNKIESEYCFAVSWRWMIDHPNSKLIIFHDSLLPRYRGFAPLVNCLINGEREIGVSAIFGHSSYDCGPIIAQSKSQISYPIKIEQAISLINEQYVKLGNLILEKINSKQELKGALQNDQQATYSLWRDERDYYIDWNQDAETIKRFIDAVGYPYKNARGILGDLTVKVVDSEVRPDLKIVNRDCGKVIFWENSDPVVVCKKGLLVLKNAYIDGDEKRTLASLGKFRLRFTPF
jgi:methionyl-tRNA formyltransferase